MSTSYEFIIVGGGVYGCATAWELAREGASVLLLEANTVASGASGGLGKRGVRANGRDPRELPLMRVAYDMWPTLAETLGGETGYERTGHVELYERDRDLPVAVARTRAQSSLGIETRQLSADEVREIEPAICEDIRTAVYAPLDGVADHGATTRSYADAAQRAGATVRQGEEVTDVGPHHVRTSRGERFEATRAIALLANTSVTSLLDQHFDVQLPIWSSFPQVMRTGPLPKQVVHGLVGHAHRVLSVKPLPDGSVMVSGGWRGAWNEARQRGEPVQAQVDGNWAEACHVFPALTDKKIIEVSTSRAETSCIDGVPIMDQVPSAPSVFYGCGWTGHGWAIAPAIAPLFASWMRDSECPAMLAPFRFARFTH